MVRYPLFSSSSCVRVFIMRFRDGYFYLVAFLESVLDHRSIGCLTCDFFSTNLQRIYVENAVGSLVTDTSGALWYIYCPIDPDELVLAALGNAESAAGGARVRPSRFHDYMLRDRDSISGEYHGLNDWDQDMRTA